MYKAQKNKKLSETEGFLNREISKFPYKVERSIGNLKQHFALNRSRYIGLAKVEAELLMVGIVFNITKATKFIGATA